jgi:hypothetical protein
MKYWFQASKTRPMLARMAQDFCSAPGILVLYLLYFLMLY